MNVSKLLMFSAFIAACVAAPSIGAHVVHEKREVSSSQWVKRNSADPELVLPVRIGLTQNNFGKGHDLLKDISNPASPIYGKHLTTVEVTELFAPSEEAVTAVLMWLVSSGISKQRIVHSDNKGWLAFDAKTEEVERLLETEFYRYEHLISGGNTIACDQYHVPKHIQKHIDYITPGTNLLPSGTQRLSSGKNRKRKTEPKNRNRTLNRAHKPSHQVGDPGDLSSCDSVMTPACIKALYKVPPADKANPSNSMGIYSQFESYFQSSLNAFFANFTPNIPQGTHPILASIDGGFAPGVFVNDSNPLELEDPETALDLQVAYPLIYPQNIELFQVGPITTNLTVLTKLEIEDNESLALLNPFLDAIDGSYCTYSAYGETGDDPVVDPTYPSPYPGGYNGTLQCGIFKPTNVISISYGTAEHNLPAYYQKRQCNEFMKLALQGVSILVASGDTGVADRANVTTGGLGLCLGSNGAIFNPIWPSNCPYVTSVGGTEVFPGKTVFEPESAALFYSYFVVFSGDNVIFYPGSSSGGFSNIYPAPEYQQGALNAYFKYHDPPYPYYEGNSSFGANGGIYNRLGRGFPDVSANGVNIATFASTFSNDGTPKFGLHYGTSASAPLFAAIINRINEERLAIGKGPVGFLNPVMYANPWMFNDITNGTNPGCGTEGFAAVEGWDPVTGLGTPDYPKMLGLFLSLP